ncbi:hypothetical protein RSPO_c02998 [Ralstonia solanacearum Po82]|uniref:Uncharacterized protein n=1 Tax=Ralstonia solanacearum (strain Po82) TaxID=1031711 RepID=F6G494_RALS8|nr:hypothetical protein RSPO_c02998 [Ralstonia solanacearum Po82]
MIVFEQQACLFKHPLFAGYADVEDNIPGRQQFGQAIHVQCVK